MGRIGNFTKWENFLPGEGNLRRSDFDNSNLFQSYKQLSVNTEHQWESRAGAMSTAKNAVFIGLQLENCCLVGVIFLGGARMSKFWAGRGTLQ